MGNSLGRLDWGCTPHHTPYRKTLVTGVLADVVVGVVAGVGWRWWGCLECWGLGLCWRLGFWLG